MLGAITAMLGDGQARSSAGARGSIKTGIDVLEAQDFAPLQGKRVGLITNQTGVDSQGRRTADILAHAPGVRLVALFSPEHGIGAKKDAPVSDSQDAATGLPIYSLYGEVRRPTDAMLKSIDILVFDIQDAGVRFYTYVTTMAYCMEEAASRHIAYFVLDRPDPLGGEVIEGPALDPGRTSFTGYFPMPVRYAMTIGELAQVFNSENHIGADLHVIPMQGWNRRDAYDQTGLRWISPSPNLRTVDAAFLYPGIEILQAGGVSVGRGTKTPFEVVGAPWIAAGKFVAELTKRRIPGVRFAPVKFTPTDGPYSRQACQGAQITVTDRAVFRSMRLGLEIADALHRMYANRFVLNKDITLLGSQSTIDRLNRGDAPAEIVAGWSADLDKFRMMREKYLLYK
ncbi:MAG TPA: DUF1343 domain-containing protein [Candidatus Acidoferrales bacterium]|nr:DUF1343 domain-containing protein [Candidatus Acidoferrales bacterium]